MGTVSKSFFTWIGIAGFAFAAFPSLVSAQWTRVFAVPATDVFTISANADTLVAGLDSTIYVSTDKGITWRQSATVAPGLNAVTSVLVYHGRLYAGTDPKGVFVSDDLGDTWTGYSQGLAGLGSFHIAELMIRGDSLYAATVGGAAWVRDLSTGPWILFGSSTLQAFQASNMTAIAAGGSRLFAAGGFNGTVFYRDPGDPDWTASLLLNDRLAPGLAGLSAIWTGHRWVVGSNIGLFHSSTGREPWTYVDFGIRSIAFVGFATLGPDLFASLSNGSGTLVVMSRDGGVTWQGLDTLPSTFIYRLARHGTTLYAGRVDGLWRRSIANVASVPDGVPPSRLFFAIEGSPAIGDGVRFAFELPDPGPIEIEVFDIAGRRVGRVIRETRPAGRGEIEWDTRRLAAGVYYARLTSAGRHATARLVHFR